MISSTPTNTPSNPPNAAIGNSNTDKLYILECPQYGNFLTIPTKINGPDAALLNSQVNSEQHVPSAWSSILKVFGNAIATFKITAAKKTIPNNSLMVILQCKVT